MFVAFFGYPACPVKMRKNEAKSSPQPILTPALSKGEGERKEREPKQKKSVVKFFFSHRLK
jgi:hypothetical protein